MNSTEITTETTPELTVLEQPMTLPAALKAMDADGWLTAVVPVGLNILLKGRAEQEAGEDYPILNPPRG